VKRVSKRSKIAVIVGIVAALVTIVASQWVSAGSSDAESVMSQSMAGLTERGVPVKSWSLVGPVLSVMLESASKTDVGTPEDPINVSLAQREAFLAKSRGIGLGTLKLEVVNAEGKSLFLGETVLDKELSPEWSVGKALSEADVAGAVQAAIHEKTDLSGLKLAPMTLISESGAREIRLNAVAAGVEAANLSTAALMISLYNAINDTNTQKNGQIALAFVDITDEAGKPLLKWVYDAQRGTQDWWQAPGMTTDWFETPAPASRVKAK